MSMKAIYKIVALGLCLGLYPVAIFWTYNRKIN